MAMLACAALSISCATKPLPAPTPAASPEPARVSPVAPPSPPAVGTVPFDPATVTAEEKNATFTDVKAFILSLNSIIQRKDYDAWLSHLTPEYIAYYSDPAVLAQISDYPVLKRMGVNLRSLKDYFLYVVYPARQNDRVDDIEFTSEEQVKAITISPKGDRQILYNLEKVGDSWKIGIGR